jgi:RNA polymerase sigma-70 factor (ECF subfamily)
LLEISGSPVVAINRAVAIGELRGASAGLAALEQVGTDARVKQYQPYWAARADLLAKRGASEEAREAYGTAIGLERDPAVRRFLQSRLAVVTTSRQTR